MKKIIDEIIQELIPLYSEDDHDLPDQLLWKHPDIQQIQQLQRHMINLLFPGRSGEIPQNLATFFEEQLTALHLPLRKEIEKAIPYRWRAASEQQHTEETVDTAQLTTDFLRTLPAIRSALILDVQAAYNGDPAALSYAEVKLSYPGIIAIASHRIAHELYRMDIPLIPRIMNEYVHSLTGIDIHPGATIGAGFFIDHGTGVVIGETTHIGDHVKLYQGVTLGAKSFPLDENGRPIKHIQRHPTVEDHVVIYANSTILGGDTRIGEGTVVAGNVFLMESTPPRSLVTRAENGVVIRPHTPRENSAQI
jgi:serine O-acetyltransferase